VFLVRFADSWTEKQHQLANSGLIPVKESVRTYRRDIVSFMGVIKQEIPWPNTAPPQTRGRFTRFVRIAMAIAMFSQVAVLLKLNGLEIPLFQNSGRHWLWAELLVCFLGACAAFTTAALFQERRLTGNLAAGIGCVLAWAYYLLMEPFAYFASEQSSTLFALPFLLLLPIATILSLRDVFVELKAFGRKAAGSSESRPESLNAILRGLEETEYFIPALYVLQGTSVLVLLFLASLDKPFSFTANLGNSTAAWSENSFYLLLAAGVLSISAAVLRNSARTASGIIALQGALAGFWFGFIVFRATVNAAFLHGLAPKSGSADSAGGVGGTILLALFFLPLVFTFSHSVKDLLETENAAAILMRLMAGCCGIVLLRLFQWREVGLSVGASLFLIGGFLGYVLAAVHPRSFFWYAVAAASLCASLALIVLGTLLILPDFSGSSLFTRQRSDISFVLLANIGLAFATAIAAVSFQKSQRKLR
jgi:hypothetical protein